MEVRTRMLGDPEKCSRRLWEIFRAFMGPGSKVSFCGLWLGGNLLGITSDGWISLGLADWSLSGPPGS